MAAPVSLSKASIACEAEIAPAFLAKPLPPLETVFLPRVADHGEGCPVIGMRELTIAHSKAGWR